jgi:quercetin dioxygenase-like cupin family protein
MSDPTQPFEDAASAALSAELAETMTAFLQPTAPSPEVLDRLLSAVAQPPQRYAPFFGRLAELFDLSEDVVVAHCARLADPSVWRFAGLPGIKNVMVEGGPRVEGAEVLFARFAPGLRFPRHVHTALERVLVLEGSYEDSEGVVHRAGELLEWQPGTRHGFRVGREEPCIAATVVYGRTFEALPFRLLARVLGR